MSKNTALPKRKEIKMKRLFILILAALMCVSIVSCSSKESEPELGGAVLEGYEDVPFRKLMRDLCEEADERAKNYGGEDCGVTCKFSNGWNTKELDQRDYVGAKQAAITCSISSKTKMPGISYTSILDFYFVHDLESNTLKLMGCRSYYNEGGKEEERFGDSYYAWDILGDMLPSDR